jgi:hypothetical protein
MGTEFAGAPLQSGRGGFLISFNSARIPPIGYFGSNYKFLEGMTYNIGGEYVS